MQKIQKGSKSSGEKREKKIDIPQLFKNVLAEMEVNHQIVLLDCFLFVLFFNWSLKSADIIIIISLCKRFYLLRALLEVNDEKKI